MKKKILKYSGKCRNCWTETRYSVETEPETISFPKRLEKTCTCQMPISLRIENKKRIQK